MDKHLIAFLNRPFRLLDKLVYRVFFVCFCGLFTCVFLYLFNPFNIQSWKYDLGFANQLSIFASGLLAIPVLAFTQLLLRPWWVPQTFSIGHFLLGVCLEWLLLSATFTLIYGKQVALGWPLWQEFWVVAKHVGLISSAPYTLGLLLLAVMNKPKLLPAPLSRENPMEASDWISVKDENDKEVLQLKTAHLLFCKSEDNYLSVFYWLHGELKKELVRTNLKKLSAELNPAQFLRTHRSYLVNLEAVVAANRKDKGLTLKLRNLAEVEIPVSASYKEAFLARTSRN